MDRRWIEGGSKVDRSSCNFDFADDTRFASWSLTTIACCDLR